MTPQQFERLMAAQFTQIALLHSIQKNLANQSPRAGNPATVLDWDSAQRLFSLAQAAIFRQDEPAEPVRG